MAKPTGAHKATKKGDNGKVSPTAPGQTTASTDGPYGKKGKSPAGGNNSRIAIASRAGK